MNQGGMLKIKSGLKSTSEGTTCLWIWRGGWSGEENVTGIMKDGKGGAGYNSIIRWRNPGFREELDGFVYFECRLGGGERTHTPHSHKEHL